MILFSKKNFELTKEFSFAWFKATDRRKILGFLWNFLNPLIITLILLFLFQKNFGLNKSEYFLYILIGTLAWNNLSSTIQSSITVLTWRREMVKNIVFPKETLVLARVGTQLISHFIGLLIVFIFLAIFQTKVGINLLYFPAVFLLEILLIIGLSLIFAFISVYISDMEYIWAALVRMGFFLVPIFYELKDLPPNLKNLVAINPLTQIMIFYRNCLIYNQAPNAVNFVIILLFTLSLFGLGIFLFRRYEQHLAERV